MEPPAPVSAPKPVAPEHYEKKYFFNRAADPARGEYLLLVNLSDVPDDQNVTAVKLVCRVINGKGHNVEMEKKGDELRRYKDSAVDGICYVPFFVEGLGTGTYHCTTQLQIDGREDWSGPSKTKTRKTTVKGKRSREDAADEVACAPEGGAVDPVAPEVAGGPAAAPRADDIPKISRLEPWKMKTQGRLAWSWSTDNPPQGITYAWILRKQNGEEVQKGETRSTHKVFLAVDDRLDCDKTKKYRLEVRVVMPDRQCGDWERSSPQRVPPFAPRNAVSQKVRRLMWDKFYPLGNETALVGSMMAHDCLGCLARGTNEVPEPEKLSPLLSNVQAGHIISHARGGPEGRFEEEVWDFMPICKCCNGLMKTTNAIQWFYDQCSKRGNSEVLYEVLWRLRDAHRRGREDMNSENDIVEFAVKMYHEGDPNIFGDDEVPWKHTDGGFDCKTTGFKSGLGGRERVESADVRGILSPAILGLDTKTGEIEARITKEREIERIMRKETMRLMKAGVDPNSIDVTTK